MLIYIIGAKGSGLTLFLTIKALPYLTDNIESSKNINSLNIIKKIIKKIKYYANIHNWRNRKW